MARVELVTKRFKDKISKIEKIVQADSLKNEIGNLCVRYISGVVRTGVDVETKEKFLPLKQSTIENRKRLEKYNKTHPAYSSKRSNLTFSGQLLDAISFEKILGGIKLFIKDNFRIPYRGKKKVYKTKVTNREIASYQLKKGRRILSIDKKLELQILRKIKSFVRLVLRSS